MKPQTSRVAVLALFGWLAEGCTIRAEVNVGEEAGGATSSIEDPTYDPCVAADSLPDDDKDAAMEAAEARLASEGKSVAEAWSNHRVLTVTEAGRRAAPTVLVARSTGDEVPPERGRQRFDNPRVFSGTGTLPRPCKPRRMAPQKACQRPPRAFLLPPRERNLANPGGALSPRAKRGGKFMEINPAKNGRAVMSASKVQ